MLKYNIKFTVAEISHMFKVERDTVKTWAYKFSEYLSSNANPPKGNVREFQIDDISVMAYIYTEWEGEPDIECIKIGLNSNSQFDNPQIDDLITSLIPIFLEPPENLDETWKHGVIFSGLASLVDMITFARSYKLAGDRLVEIALENEEAVDLFYPAMFNYRHSVELYLKVLTNKYPQSHDLKNLYDKLKDLLKSDFGINPPKWFENIILGFNEFDPGSTAFRYGGGHEKDEVFVDFIHLKTLMGWLSLYFQKILHRQGLNY
jgi:hypothetical protein